MDLSNAVTKTDIGIPMEQKAVLTLQEASKFTGLSASTLYKLTSTRMIPHSKPMGKKLYFDRLALEAWMLSNPVRTKADIEGDAVNYVTNKVGLTGKRKGGTQC